MNPTDYGCTIVTIEDEPQIAPQWDSAENMLEMNLIRKSHLRKCGCTKGCRNRLCSCVKNGDACSNLCTCIGCVNKPGNSQDIEEQAEEEVELDDEDDNEEEENDYVTEDLRLSLIHI